MVYVLQDYFDIFMFSVLHPPLAGAGAVRDKPPAAGAQLQPQLPHLLPGGGRRRHSDQELSQGPDLELDTRGDTGPCPCQGL